MQFHDESFAGSMTKATAGVTSGRAAHSTIAFGRSNDKTHTRHGAGRLSERQLSGMDSAVQPALTSGTNAHDRPGQSGGSEIPGWLQSVKQVKSVKPGHTARNILIGVGIAVVAIGTVAGIGVMLAEK